jgi:lysophosphatidic acid acyltransferase/lysophosphatidylinositol acyltransferase
MNMCSKCYKDVALKQEQDNLAVSSFQSIVNGSSSSNGVGDSKTAIVTEAQPVALETVAPTTQVPTELSANDKPEETKQGPKRCGTCRKRVGLTGFNCRCGSIYCAIHRYSDKHECTFDYRTAGQEAIAKANPVVKAEKLDKI